MQRRIESARQVDDGLGALHVGRALLGFGDGDVVDRRAMHHVADISEFGDRLVGEPEPWLSQLADQRLCPGPPLCGQRFEAAERRATNQDPHFGVRAARLADGTPHGAQ